MRGLTFSRQLHSKVTRVPIATELKLSGNILGNTRNNTRESACINFPTAGLSTLLSCATRRCSIAQPDFSRSDRERVEKGDPPLNGAAALSAALS